MRLTLNPDVEEMAARMVAENVAAVAQSVRDAAAALAPPAKQWITVEDDRVRRWHQRAHGQRCPANVPFILHSPSDDGSTFDAPGSKTEYPMEPRDPVLSPAQRYNCFPAETLVAPTGTVRAVYRSWYEGPMVTVKTGSGRVLTGTPNHPVLTDQGWVALHLLDVGSNLIQSDVVEAPRRRRSASRVARAIAATLTPSVAPDVHHGPTAIGEVFRAALVLGHAHRVSRLAVDFHGDQPASDVEVVAANGVLADPVDTTLREAVKHLLLAYPHPSRLAARTQGQRLVSVDPASAGDVRCNGQSLAVVGASAAHPREHRSATPTRLDTSGQQQRPSQTTADAQRPSDRMLRLPAGVSTDEVVEVDVQTGWRGHVYTLLADSDTYLASGLVVANCRCVSFEIPGIVGASLNVSATRVEGTTVTVSVYTDFERAGESETAELGGGWLLTGARIVAAERRA